MHDHIYINHAEMVMPKEALEDHEGVQIMKTLGRNMAWIMQKIENGKDDLEKPGQEAKVFTHFIR